MHIAHSGVQSLDRQDCEPKLDFVMNKLHHLSLFRFFSCPSPSADIIHTMVSYQSITCVLNPPSLIPRPRPKNLKRGLVALPCMYFLLLMLTSSNACTVGHALLLQPLMSADYHSKLYVQNYTNKRCCSRLSSVFIYPV